MGASAAYTLRTDGIASRRSAKFRPPRSRPSPRHFGLNNVAGCGCCRARTAPCARNSGRELEHWGVRRLPAVELVDVDSDPELARRYGLDIPVLLLDGVRVCQHRLDSAELLRLLRPR